MTTKIALGNQMNLQMRPDQHGRWTLFGLSVVGLLFLLAYRETLVLLTAYWASNDMYSYGFLVPAMIALMFWVRRDEIPTTPVAASQVAGCVVCFIGLAILQFGRSSATNLIEEISLFVTVVGLTLLLMGWAFLRRFWFPVAYVLAMIPFWEFLTRRIQPFFQLYSATVGVWLLQSFGIPVLQEGSFIQLPNIRLEVAEACSGINHLIAVMLIGVPATLLFVRRWSRRVFILACAAGIALVSNGVRVAIVALFAYNEMRGPNGNIHGPYGLFRTLIISGVGFIVLFALITYFSDKEVPWQPAPTTDSARRGSDTCLARRVQPAAVVLAALLLCSALGVQYWHRGVDVPPSRSFGSFPTTIGQWQSRGASSFGSAFDAIGFDDRLSLDYFRPDLGTLNLRIGYFRDQAQGKKLAGWDMAKIFGDPERPHSSIDYQGVRARDFVDGGSGGRAHVTYWYLVGDTALDEDYRVRALTGFRSLFFGRSNGALIVISRQMADSDTLETSRTVVSNFVSALVPVVGRYIP